MVELIVGEKGKGKTKQILERAEEALKNASGNVIFLDKDQKHIFGLHRDIRLVDMSEFNVRSTDEFMGFINGVISQNNDIEEIILDSFLTIAYIDTNDSMIEAVGRIDELSDKFGIKFVLSISRNEADMPETLKSKITVAL